MLAMITAGDLAPERLIGKTVSLEEASTELTSMDKFSNKGVTVISEF